MKTSLLTILLVIITGCTIPVMKSSQRNSEQELKSPRQEVKVVDTKTKLASDEPSVGAVSNHAPYVRNRSKLPGKITSDLPTGNNKTISTSEVYYQLGENDTDKANSFAWYLKAAEQGEVHAYLKVGQMYLDGEGVNIDHVESARWYLKAAEAGFEYAQLNMGNFYRDGIGVSRSPEEAVRWYEQAANKNNLSAMLALGEMYKGWYDLKSDYNKALVWYRKAKMQGSEQAEYEIAWLLAKLGDDREYTQVTNELAKKSGNKNALVELGDAYLEGKNGNVKPQLAFENYLKAAKQESADGAYRLAILFATGKGTDRDHYKAALWFEKAAELGVPMGAYHVGEIYYNGWGYDKNVKEAYKWYKVAAKMQATASYVRLADLHHSGRGASRYLPEAFRWYQQAANAGDTYGQYMVSIMYRLGRGVEVDYDKSVFWDEQATAKHDKLFAMSKVARNYATGYGLPKDDAKALRWYLRAANGGLAEAQAKVGDYYASGIGTEQDLGKSLYWYKKAADQNYPYGLYNIAWSYLQGKGIAQNLYKAMNYFKKAAYQGHKPSQYQLGLMFYSGRGALQDDTKAYGWLNIALHEQNDLTPDLLAGLVDRMQPDIRKKAIKLAEIYKEKFNIKEEIILN